MAARGREMWMPLIKSNQFAASVAAALYDYEKDVLEAVGKAVVETGKRSLRVVQSKSPVRSGEYKKSWKIKEITTGIYGSQVSVIIHNKKYYRLTHLLEYGHQKKGGGRVEGAAHIRPAYEEADRILPVLTAQAIEGAAQK